MDQLEGRNPVHECLKRGKRRVKRIWMDRGAKPDPRIRAIVDLAHKNGVKLTPVHRRDLDAKAEGRVHNGVIAHADPLPKYTTKALLNEVFESGEDPFLILADGLAYEHNLGAVLRSCLGFGVHGLIVPTRRGASLSPVVQRVSMGAVEAVPVVHEGLFAAIKMIKKAGIPILGAHMGGTLAHEARMSGPLAIVLGTEGAGLSSKLREKCDGLIGVGLGGELESLNVSVAAAVLMYEKRRQDL